MIQECNPSLLKKTTPFEAFHFFPNTLDDFAQFLRTKI